MAYSDLTRPEASEDYTLQGTRKHIPPWGSSENHRLKYAILLGDMFFFPGGYTLEVQRPLKELVSPKTIFLVGNLNHPKLWTIILIALDLQGIPFSSSGKITLRFLSGDPWRSYFNGDPPLFLRIFTVERERFSSRSFSPQRGSHT